MAKRWTSAWRMSTNLVNNTGELISWTDDPEADYGTDNRALKASVRSLSGVYPRPGKQDPGLALR